MTLDPPITPPDRLDRVLRDQGYAVLDAAGLVKLLRVERASLEALAPYWNELPPDEHLQVTIDDIKLAGSFEPWRGPDAQDIRFLKDIYPPRMDLHYRLTAADGSVIREGTSRLRDLAYLQHTVPTSTDQLRYDKRMVDDWLRREFAAR